MILGVEANHGLGIIADLQRDLATANEFSDAELAINREGRIAESQVSRLAHSLVPPSLLASVPKSLLALLAVECPASHFLQPC
jgi:hypothetical protein